MPDRTARVRILQSLIKRQEATVGDLAMDTEVTSKRVRQYLLALRPLLERVDVHRWRWMGPLTTHDGQHAYNQVEALEARVDVLEGEVATLKHELDEAQRYADRLTKQGRGIAKRDRLAIDAERRMLRAKVVELLGMLG